MSSVFGKRRNRRRIVRIENRIAHHTGSGPLGVKTRLWPEVVFCRVRKVLLQMLGAVFPQLSISGIPRTPATGGVIKQIAFVALRERVRRPSFVSVGFVQPVLVVLVMRVVQTRSGRTVAVWSAPWINTIGYCLRGPSTGVSRSTYIWLVMMCSPSLLRV